MTGITDKFQWLMGALAHSTKRPPSVSIEIYGKEIHFTYWVGGALVEHLKVLSFHSRACLRILFGEDPSIGPVWTHYSYGAAIERMRKQARLIRRGSEAPTNPSRTNWECWHESRWIMWKTRSPAAISFRVCSDLHEWCNDCPKGWGNVTPYAPKERSDRGSTDKDPLGGSTISPPTQ